jgi:hypothetical protein
MRSLHGDCGYMENRYVVYVCVYIYIYIYIYGEIKLSSGSSTVDGAQTPGTSGFEILIGTVTTFQHVVTTVRIAKTF